MPTLTIIERVCLNKRRSVRSRNPNADIFSFVCSIPQNDIPLKSNIHIYIYIYIYVYNIYMCFIYIFYLNTNIPNMLVSLFRDRLMSGNNRWNPFKFCSFYWEFRIRIPGLTAKNFESTATTFRRSKIKRNISTSEREGSPSESDKGARRNESARKKRKKRKKKDWAWLNVIWFSLIIRGLARAYCFPSVGIGICEKMSLRKKKKEKTKKRGRRRRRS